MWNSAITCDDFVRFCADKQCHPKQYYSRQNPLTPMNLDGCKFASDLEARLKA